MKVAEDILDEYAASGTRIADHRKNCQLVMAPILKEFHKMNSVGMRLRSWEGDLRLFPEECNSWGGEGIEIAARYGKLHIHPGIRGASYPSNLHRIFGQEDESDDGYAVIYGEYRYWARTPDGILQWLVRTLGTDWIVRTEKASSSDRKEGV